MCATNAPAEFHDSSKSINTSLIIFTLAFATNSTLNTHIKQQQHDEIMINRKLFFFTFNSN